MIDVISVGISFPKKILTRIDSERGDVPRSRYLLRVIENILQSKDNKEANRIVTKKTQIKVRLMKIWKPAIKRVP
jgi:metal-responsive CopG/Arc/MetJ family transcriptional regulator